MPFAVRACRVICPLVAFAATVVHAALVPVPLRDASQVTVAQGHACAIAGAGQVFCWGRPGDGVLTGDGLPFRSYATLLPGFGTRVRSIAVGFGHTCAVDRDGRVLCVGSNEYGQLGTGTQEPSDVPVPVVGLPSPAVAVGAGQWFNCALLVDGGVWCWGANSLATLGDGTEVDRRLPVPVAGLASGVRSLRVGAVRSCAITTTGALKCWGDNATGALGTGDTAPRRVPVDVVGLGSGVEAVATGSGHTCASVAGAVRCWGDNMLGQLGDGTTVDRLTPAPVVGLGAVRDLHARSESTCAVLHDGTARCWGAKQWCSGGVCESGAPTSVPAPLTGVTGARVIEIGGWHACVLRYDGSVWCVGNQTQGQLGDGVAHVQTAPAALRGSPGAVRRIGLGDDTSCMVVDDGRLACWGRNGRGLNGDGTRHPRALPGIVTGLPPGATDVHLRDGHACAATGLGVHCWGSNASGQLGLGIQFGEQLMPTEPVVGVLAHAQRVATGTSSSCAVTFTGGVACWGSGNYGTTTTEVRLVPTAIAGLTEVRDVGVGDVHACALGGTGIVHCWGSNLLGQLGRPGALSGVPVPVTALGEGVQRLAVGNEHTCAVVAGGRVHCWGQGLDGQLGNGTRDQQHTPVEALGVVDAVDVAAGRGHTCALTAAGSVLCWGINLDGQLGDGTLETRTMPVDVVGLPGRAVAIFAGRSATCALLADGGAACWGLTAQLASGWTFDQDVPRPVLALYDAPLVEVPIGREVSALLAILLAVAALPGLLRRQARHRPHG